MTSPTRVKGNPVVEVEHVDFFYGKHMVLEDVTFSIMPGDFLAVIGPNGSGKSTLLKLILGLLKLQKGKIHIIGKDLEHFNEWWRIGYVPQKAVHVDKIFPITVEEVVGLGRASKKNHLKWLNREDKIAVKRALKKVGMAQFSQKKLSDLSGGQQQRVFIARGIVNDPEILFLDEPTTGVDVKAQDEFYEMLQEFNKNGITIVMVTHDIAVVNKYVNKVACLNRRLVFHGTHEEFCSSKEALSLFLRDHHLVGHRH
ncbi:Zinc ABC transporter, ATP-binding protein ZnuC [Dissulfuribacter thermophilus]|uniref:Zinc ABC transporter, ATP-binding protein ZnuC n=1 Tax=Dissulfuribacter thermophilus TaxID=1156395 RepID=A0A1B9F6W3_9BACT|nr:metal ABC transporter ATP-binding protein [Dissulfuribacter thermophilus]OCC15698.1 Zinc ABC transporter, ATP-binding protein ZnuC [Dissulfuribacter thermophilus]